MDDADVAERMNQEPMRNPDNRAACGIPRRLPTWSAQGAGEFRILIVEDNVDAADTLREVLELATHRVEVAWDGVEGLDRVRSFLPHVVLCDIGLPNMNGYEFARTLRRDERLQHTYLIAMTGYAHVADRSHAFAAGFDRHMAKPFQPDELMQVLDAIRSGDVFRERH